MKKLFFLIISFILISTLGFSQDLGNGWALSGQVQLRSELDGRDFSNTTHPLTFTSMRTRLGINKNIEDKISFFIQISDSRVFGQEPNSLVSISNLDLHQGYVKLNNLFDWNWSLQAGRFEVSYGTERFFGAVGWHFVGRSFDGVRFNIAPDKINLRNLINMLAMQIQVFTQFHKQLHHQTAYMVSGRKINLIMEIN